MNRILISFGFGLLLALFANAENAPIYSSDANGKTPSIEVGGNYYFIVEEKLSWIGAADYCRKKGAHLASLENVAEQLELSNFIASKKPKEVYWLSRNDIGREGTFSRFCVSLSSEEERLKLNYDVCQRSYYFVCEASVK